MRRASHTTMRRTRTIVLAGLVCGLGGANAAGGQDAARVGCDQAPRAERTAVILHLVDRAALSPGTRAQLMRETVLPWRETGVDVRWAMDERDADGGAGHVYVTVVRDAEAPRGPGFGHPLASILFVGGRPTTQIRAYLGEIERLASASRFDDHAWLDLPRLLRERLIGRALGRAVAHEVGHYVFASATHAPVGLMRPHHPIERLMTAAGDPFRIIPPP